MADLLASGEAALRMGDFALALSQFRQALAQSQNDARALIGCGIACGQSGDLDQAEHYLKRAAMVAPQAATVHANLAKLALEKGDWKGAETSARRAIALCADDPVAHDNLCVALKRQGRWQDAQAALDTALACCERRPGNLFHTLGEFRLRRGDVAGAVEAFRRAPETAANISALVGCFNYADLLSPREVARLHRDAMARLAKVHGSVLPRPAPPRRGMLRIGYVSGDLRDHSVAFFIEAVLAAHDRDAFAIHCYATGPSDAVTARLKALGASWRGCARMSDGALAKTIRDDGIDILVDLGGHTLGNRLSVFAMRPAPVQATWIGYPNTTGLEAMDFRLTDAVSDPPEADAFYTERLMRLPGGFLCYQPPAEAPVPKRSSREPFTFASFNAVPKYSGPCIGAFADILKRVPQSRLMLKAVDLANPLACTRLLDAFRSHGLDSGRIDLHPLVADRREHLATYHHVDLALDPFPYNGTTTTCEALWMGVPVLTLQGGTHAGRVGASLLTQIGLQGDLIAPTVADYVTMAVALADPARTEQRVVWRAGLRASMRASLLYRPEAFVPMLEAAYTEMAALRRNEMEAAGGPEVPSGSRG